MQRADSNRQLAKSIMKKKQQMKDFGPKRFGGADTAGSEADESQINSEAPVIRRKVGIVHTFLFHNTARCLTISYRDRVLLSDHGSSM